MTRPPRNDRRGFLQGLALRDAVRHRLDEVAEAVERELPAAEAGDASSAGGLQGAAADRERTGDGEPDAYLIELSREAMACEFGIQMRAGESLEVTDAALEALDLLEPIEQRLSAYRIDSELSMVNRLAAHEWVPVTAEMFALLARAQELSAVTDGAFDVTAGQLIKAWGFYRRAGRVPDAGELAAARDCVGHDLLALDHERLRVRFLRAGVELNLGAIGKGYALDRCAERLREAGLNDFLLHGGRSSMLAGGSRLAARPEDGWLVSIRHPLRPDRPITEVRLHNQALGTSGCGTQYFYHEGVRYGHILDPRRGQPASGTLSTSVVAADAATADALSTAFHVMTIDEVSSVCERMDSIGVITIVPGNRSGEVVLHRLGRLT